MLVALHGLHEYIFLLGNTIAPVKGCVITTGVGHIRACVLGFSDMKRRGWTVFVTAGGRVYRKYCRVCVEQSFAYRSVGEMAPPC